LQSAENSDARALLAATLDWWREAGVDCAFSDDPQRWLADEADLAPARGQQPGAQPAERRKVVPPQAPVVQVQKVQIGGNPAVWPQDVEEFARWWLTDPSLDHAPALRRVPPLGRAGAELMVLVPMPEAGDEAVLLSGRAGALLDAMLAAMGLSRDRAYLAAALPSRNPAPDWAALAEAGMGAVLAHHVRLAAPKKLLVLGKSVVSTLLGHAPAKNDATSPAFNHEGGSVPLGASYDLEAMLSKPALKAGVWKQWLEWTASEQR
jgi:DNA polymerase